MENQTNSYSTEFLNQLNNKPPSKFSQNKFLYLVGGGIGIIILTLIGILILSNQKTVTTNSLLIQTEQVAKIVKKYHKDLEDNQLRSVDSNLQLSLTNYIRDLNKYKNKDEKTTEKPDDSAIYDQLDDASLNALLDRNYTQIMIFELDKLMIETDKLYRRSKKSDIKEILKTNYTNISAIKDQFEAIKL